jgi:hypothetical protein
LTPRGAPLADILVHSSDGTPVAQIQVKARSGRHGHGWRLSKKNEDPALAHGRLFYALIDFGRPAGDFPIYVVPSATVADYLRSAHEAWLATPGKGGKEHHDWAGRFVSPALPFEVPRYPDGWLDEYRDRWDLLVAPSAEADDEPSGGEPAIEDLSDRQILAGMAAGSPDLWARLFAAADALRSDPEPSAMVPAVQQSDGSYSFPYPRYSDTVEEIVQLLYDLNIVVPFDWDAWYQDGGRIPSPDEVARGSAAEAARLVTAIVRAERFSEGTLANALADGTLEAALARLRRWYDEERRAN